MRPLRIRCLRNADLPAVQELLEDWIREPASREVLGDEVVTVMAEMKEALESSPSSRFWVAADAESSVIGTIGLRPPSQEMLTFSQGHRPGELVHAFIKKGSQERGTGTLLVNNLEAVAKRTGYDEVLVNSGPRYADSWGFYDQLKGFERRGTAKDFYGQGQHARVWGKLL